MGLAAWSLNEEVTSSKFNDYIKTRPDFGWYWQDLQPEQLYTDTGLNLMWEFMAAPIVGDYLFVAIDTRVTTATSVQFRLSITDITNEIPLLFFESAANTSGSFVTQRLVANVFTPRLAGGDLGDGVTLLSDIRGRTMKVKLFAINTGGTTSEIRGAAVGWGKSSDVLDYGEQF